MYLVRVGGSGGGSMLGNKDSQATPCLELSHWKRHQGAVLPLAEKFPASQWKLDHDWIAHHRLGGESRKEEEKGRRREEGGEKMEGQGGASWDWKLNKMDARKRQEYYWILTVNKNFTLN